jgi:hypothetical protein
VVGPARDLGSHAPGSLLCFHLFKRAVLRGESSVLRSLVDVSRRCLGLVCKDGSRVGDGAAMGRLRAQGRTLVPEIGERDGGGPDEERTGMIVITF